METPPPAVAALELNRFFVGGEGTWW